MPGGHALLVSLNGHGRANIVKLVAKLANIKVRLYICYELYFFTVNVIWMATSIFQLLHILVAKISRHTIEYVLQLCLLKALSELFSRLAFMLSGIHNL